MHLESGAASTVFLRQYRACHVRYYLRTNPAQYNRLREIIDNSHIVGQAPNVLKHYLIID